MIFFRIFLYLKRFYYLLPSGWSLYSASGDYILIPCPSPLLFPIAFFINPSYVFRLSIKHYQLHTNSCRSMCDIILAVPLQMEKGHQGRQQLGNPVILWVLASNAGGRAHVRKLVAECWPIWLFPLVALKFSQDKKLLLNNPQGFGPGFCDDNWFWFRILLFGWVAFKF